MPTAVYKGFSSSDEEVTVTIKYKSTSEYEPSTQDTTTADSSSDEC